MPRIPLRVRLLPRNTNPAGHVRPAPRIEERNFLESGPHDREPLYRHRPKKRPGTVAAHCALVDLRHLGLRVGVLDALHHELRVTRTLLPSVYRRLGAPLWGKASDTLVHSLIEAQQVADHPAVEQRAVGVGVREVGGL